MYIGDSLQFFLEKKELEVSAKLDLPIFIKNRILVFEEREILVFESSKLIKRFNIERATYKDYDIYKGPNWVNICDGGEKNWIYTYSYKDNKFFRNPKN